MQSFANMVSQPAKSLSGVKGLGATKVTALVDAFHKPFLVGGLRRRGQEKEDKLIVAMPTSAVLADTGARPGSSGEAVRPRENPHENGGTITAQADPVSPDWPDEEDQEDSFDPPVDTSSYGRGRAPSRSPGLGPELQAVQTNDSVQRDEESSDRAWKDPLDDDEDGENDEDDEPALKRAKR